MHTLTPYEHELVNNAEILLTKNRIIEKTINLFSELSHHYQQIMETGRYKLPVAIPPKISRGEKYLGLPYLVLDYPRHFTTADTLAIRTLFWWGNYFSITLQLEGMYQQVYAENIQKAMLNQQLDGWLLQTGGDKWQHEISERYRPVEDYEKDTLRSKPFLKITKKIPLQEWDRVQEILQNDFLTLLKVISFSKH